MFKAFESRQLSDLTVAEKRNLVKALRESIKDQVLISKQNKALIKINKDNAKKAKIADQIKAAQEKLAKLQAKLT